MERLDVFMARANAAYYAAHDPFADFTTAPEISQVFGEVLGLWAAVTWEAMGRPDPVLLAEAGPGRGTLMRDALRAVRRVAPSFGTALQVHLIETSPRLRTQQREAVPDAVWHDDLGSLPKAPLILLANEFLDALPVRQFVRTQDGWAERHVRDGRYVLTPPDDLPSVLQQEGRDDIYELNEAALAFAELVAGRVDRDGGAALILDYGPENSASGDSLQAIRDGRPADPLAEPGSADLTAHVDFAALARAARRHGATVHGPVPQGVFLARLGLFQRTDRLARTQPVARAAALMAAARRLAEPAAMGRMFKVMAIAHPDLLILEGFSA